MEAVRYGVGSWKADGLGNHRAVVQVREKAEAMRVRIPWRRRDREPEKKDIIVIDAATGERVENAVRVEVRRAYGEIVFQPRSGPGEYYVYFMPFVQEGWQHMPSTRYLPPRETAEAAWIAANGLEEARPGEELPRAEVVEIQAVNAFHRMEPMEVAATEEEVEALIGRYADRAYLVFPEDRRYPIRMREGLPLRWVETGPGKELSGTACRGEFFAFQLGVYAVDGPLENVGVTFGNLRGRGDRAIPARRGVPAGRPLHRGRCFRRG